jgi:hypothetical protein
MNFGALQTYIRQRLGIEQNQTIQDSELITMINLSLAALDEILCTDYEDYNLQTYLAVVGVQTPANPSSNNLIALPPDFFKLRGVDFGSPGQWITIYGFGLQQRNYFNSPYANMYANYGNQVQRKVRVQDRNIIVEPLNLCAGQYQIWYTPKFTWLVNPTDPLPTAMDTESFIEYAVAATGEKVYTKLILPTTVFQEQKAYYEEKVRNSAKNRMSLGPQVMQNVRNRGRGWAWGRGGFRS